MWPPLLDIGVMRVTVWGLSLTVAFVVGSFVLWRRLRDDYDPELLLTLWLWLVVIAWLASGVWACGWFGQCVPVLVSIDGAILGSIAFLVGWSHRKKWNFWELLDAVAPVSLAVGVLAAIGWSPSGWLVALVAVVGVILTAVLKRMYRYLGWYKSGKTGFVGIIALGWWGVVQLVVANFTAVGLYSLAWVVVAAGIMLYIRSGRQISDDLSHIWPIKKR